MEDWYKRHKSQAFKSLKELKIQAYMEVKAELLDTSNNFSRTELRDAAGESTIPTFGWPIAVFLGNRMEYKPVYDKDGIRAEVSIKRHELDGSKTYDYWAISTNGSFYTLKSIFEDLRNPEIISFNTRIVRITEVFMYLRNLYSNLGIAPDKKFNITIKHGGIKGRKLSTLSQNRLMLGTYISSEDDISTTITTSIRGFEKNASDVVESFTEPLFEMFDFHKVNRSILEDIVQNYLNGKVT